ncbi:hypothetical protein K505DRAFT_414330 [Melanomma pulvis-pyrius CBS 109.77]|uniref:Uncharacterized protein n=1 Tax=Melanomma pulvis-pyrius CBS 109.77 TaxID=1314802 RepID=A0A6A6XQ33_9PLEO|nr:hypothetical protein K505DRAFT_414330 [Melanomma pulvis-pyrius CBS 109.77]
MHQHRVAIRSEQLPISAIAKCPLLAIRWNINNEKDNTLKTHRVQLKFESGEEYEIAYNHLRLLGLRISQQQQPPQPPSTANSTSSLTSPINVRSSIPSFPPSQLADIPNPSCTAGFVSLQPVAMLSSSGTQSQETSAIRPASAYTVSHSDPLIPPEYFSRPASSSSILTLPSSNTAVAIPGRPTFSNLSLPSSSTATTKRDHRTESSTIKENTTASASRPGSAMLYVGPDTSDIVIPPRRELPFGRSTSPKSSDSDKSLSATRALSSTMGPPSLPSAKRTVRRPTSGRSEALAMPPLPQPTIIEGTENQMHVGTSPGRSLSRGSDRSLLSQSSILEKTKIKAATPRSLGRTPHLGEINGATQNSQRLQPQDVSTLPASDTFYQDRVASELYNTVAANGNDGLAAYAIQSEEGRKTALNDFMMQHIDDENFVTLVQDVSTCWSRIGLGLD